MKITESLIYRHIYAKCTLPFHKCSMKLYFSDTRYMISLYEYGFRPYNIIYEREIFFYIHTQAFYLVTCFNMHKSSSDRDDMCMNFIIFLFPCIFGLGVRPDN